MDGNGNSRSPLIQQIVFMKQRRKHDLGGQKGVCEGGSTGGTDMVRRLSDEWVAIF